MKERERLSASIDRDLLAGARQAVAEGRVPSVSVWVNEALRRHADHDRRMRALDEFVATYESEHGEITEAEMADAKRRARARAVVVRGSGGQERKVRQGGPVR